MLAQPIVRSLEFAWRGMRAAVAAIGRVFEILMNTVLAVASVVFLCGVVALLFNSNRGNREMRARPLSSAVAPS